MKIDIKSMLPEEISDKLSELRVPGFHASQIFRHLSRGVITFEDMTDLSRELRYELERNFYISAPVLDEKLESQTDPTVKYLWRLRDGDTIETVLMRYRHGLSLCVSSQAGCRMGCSFCASTVGGLTRNLEPSEILDQVLFTELEAGEKISNIVMMGIGEPLDNFDNVIRFLQLVTHPKGRNLGMRHITLSTCGLADAVDKLAEYNLQLTLSVSLHAPDDETRSKLMPISRVYGITRLLESCDSYFKKTGRRVTFEYAVIAGINDMEYHARMLANEMKKVRGHVNLIPLNEVEGRLSGYQTGTYKTPGDEEFKCFANMLHSLGVNVTARRRLGGDIDASCGQLRLRRRQEDDVEP